MLYRVFCRKLIFIKFLFEAFINIISLLTLMGPFARRIARSIYKTLKNIVLPLHTCIFMFES